MIALFAVLIIILINTGKWRNWKLYYPTILLMMLGDVTFNFITHDHPFWHYYSTLIPSHTVFDLLHVVVAFPCIVILFLSYIPKGLLKKIIYILSVSAIYALIEYVMYLDGKFEYFNGWNTLYSFVFDIGLYSIIMLHHKKPLIAWLCIIIVVPLFLLIVKFPLNKLI